MAEVYHDRKMMKWLPFQALPEHGQSLYELYASREKIQKPILSQDQYETMQYTFETAYHEGKVVEFKLFKNNHIEKIKGHIIGADMTLGIIMLGNGSVVIEEIIDVDIV